MKKDQNNKISGIAMRRYMILRLTGLTVQPIQKCKMIETAMKKRAPDNVHFSVEDATARSFLDQIFDAVIISNALHIMPDPGVAL